MPASSFCASRPRDATRRMSATELVLRSSVAAATPSQQHYNLALKTKRVVSSFCTSRPSLRCSAAVSQQQLRSSVAAAAAGDGVVPRR